MKSSWLRPGFKFASLASQLNLPSKAGLAPTSHPSSLPQAVFRGRCFVHNDRPAREGREGESCWIQNEGFFVREIKENPESDNTFWVCSRCDTHGNIQTMLIREQKNTTSLQANTLSQCTVSTSLLPVRPPLRLRPTAKPRLPNDNGKCRLSRRR
ncbi:hypothetical protein F4821DRAFT_247079 [Hypoxylon rubiginosum]|uniref:Uncharacterized protein n=1 Tax=Hypoxylon rubiginosum TaxID=110542 RepID=A0ACC0CPL9_9PEZI|nr:hypothetical protein F4821DRAFT_247079 [Hypoxylon rubiginosum]